MSDTAKFCSECGAPITVAPAAKLYNIYSGWRGEWSDTLAAPTTIEEILAYVNQSGVRGMYWPGQYFIGRTELTGEQGPEGPRERVVEWLDFVYTPDGQSLALGEQVADPPEFLDTTVFENSKRPN